jgi:hypothetical protein
MTYMHDLEQKLRDWLISFADGDVSTDQIVTFLKQSHLESFRNGQAAGPRPARPEADRTREPQKPQWHKRSAANAPSRGN